MCIYIVQPARGSARLRALYVCISSHLLTSGVDIRLHFAAVQNVQRHSQFIKSFEARKLEGTAFLARLHHNVEEVRSSWSVFSGTSCILAC
jgi:hypothetical protein